MVRRYLPTYLCYKMEIRKAWWRMAVVRSLRGFRVAIKSIGENSFRVPFWTGYCDAGHSPLSLAYIRGVQSYCPACPAFHHPFGFLNPSRTREVLQDHRWGWEERKSARRSFTLPIFNLPQLRIDETRGTLSAANQPTESNLIKKLLSRKY